MKTATILYSALIVLFVSSCAGSEKSKPQNNDSVEFPVQPINVDSIQSKVNASIDAEKFSYAMGRRVAGIVSRQVRNPQDFIPNQFLSAYFYAIKNADEIDMQEVQQVLYQRNYNNQSTEGSMSYSQALGYFVAKQNSPALMSIVDPGVFGKGFNNQVHKGYEELQADSLVMVQTETYQKEIGTRFLEANAKREGVQVTASGLQYQVIEEGEGEKPVASSKVTTHYRGTLLNGEEFDSSYKRGEPISFSLGQVIPGWTEGLQLMNKGAKYRLFIPQNLAYGARNAGSIPAYSTLIFDIELIDFK
jgi:FKBP-type peptidyl-prolyl cis-trans isomerase